MPLKSALVLTGGGARGAYQAGAMRAIGEIVRRNKIDRPFDIFCGNSAGAINSAFLASQVHQFSAGCDRLCDFWESLTTDQIYKTDFKSLLGRGARWVWELSTGGLYERKLVRSLLDTSPLLRLIHREIDFSKIESNIRDGLADAIAITAVSYSTGDSRTFFQSHQGVRAWEKVRRDSVATTLLPKHVMASSAIPILFPPVKLGDDYFGDGSLRNYTPMSPAIHLGADRILVIGVRCKYCMGETHAKQPSLGRILSVILNYVLLDAIDYDYENLTRVNMLLGDRESVGSIKPIQIKMLRPTADIGHLAAAHSSEAPRLLRYLIRGLGTNQEAADLISYLLFEPSFLRSLSSIGYSDTIAQEPEILEFLGISGK